jgi:FxsC-like protein
MFSGEANVASFTIVVVAPASPDLPAGCDRAAYGPSAKVWRPFGAQQQLPLAQYARIVAEQLDFAVEVIDIEKASGVFISKPGVMLIDPWYVADVEGLTAFRTFARELPPWALPVLVPHPESDQLSSRVRTALQESSISRSEPARRGLSGVTSLREFVNLMPFLASQAEREYLRHASIRPSTAPEIFRSPDA